MPMKAKTEQEKGNSGRREQAKEAAEGGERKKQPKGTGGRSSRRRRAKEAAEGNGRKKQPKGTGERSSRREQAEEAAEGNRRKKQPKEASGRKRRKGTVEKQGDNEDMKYVIFGLCASILIVSILMTTVTIEGSAIRKREIKNALHAALEDAMTSALSRETNALDDRKLLVADVTALLIEQLNSSDKNLKLQVDVAAADAKKGLLSLHVTEYFTYPSGKTGKVEDEATIILEQEIPKNYYRLTYRLPESITEELLLPEIIRSYTIEEQQKCKVPRTPSGLLQKGYEITSWINTGTNASYTGEQLAALDVSENMNLVAVVKQK